MGAEAGSRASRSLHARNPASLEPEDAEADDDGNALFTFNASAASRALELIGKHTEVAAFKDRLEVSGGQTLAERIQAGRRRAYGNHGPAEEDAEAA